jgi:hypothetical protein
MMDAAASIADTASSMSGKKKAAGGTAEKDVGSGTPYDAGSNPYMPDSAESIDKKELAKPGAAPDAPESGFSQALHFAKDVGSIAALAMMMNRGGRTGYANGGVGDEEELNYPTQEGGIPSPTPVEAKELPAPGAYSALSPAEKVALNARMDAQLNNEASAYAAANKPPQQAAPPRNLADIIKQSQQVVPGMTVTSGLRTPERNAAVNGAPNSAHMSGKAYDFVPPKGMTLADAAAVIKGGVPGTNPLVEGPGAKYSTGPHVHVGFNGGVAPPLNAAAVPVGGLGGTKYAQLDTGIKSDAAPAPAAAPAAVTGLQPSSQVPMPKPDIEAGPYNKTERWLLPLLSGAGAMFSSPNRYGLGAFGEGVGAAASQYGKMQEDQYKKGQEQQQAGTTAQNATAQSVSATASAQQAANQKRQIDLDIIRLTISNLEKTFDPITGNPVWVNRLNGEKLSDEQRDQLVQHLNELSGNSLGEIGQPSGPRSGATNSNTPLAGTPVKAPVPASQVNAPPSGKTSFVSPASPGHPAIQGVPVTSISIDETQIPMTYRPSEITKIIQKANSDIIKINNDPTLDPERKEQQLKGLNNIIESANRRRADLQSGNVFDEAGQPIMQARNLHDQMATNMAVNQKIPEIVEGVQQQLPSLDAAAKVLRNYASGAYSAPFAQASRWLGSGELASQREILNKEAVNSIINQLNASARNLGAGIGVMNEVSGANFGPDLQPSANKTVLAQIYGQANWLLALAKAKQSSYAANQTYDQGKFVQEWSAANPISAFKEAAYKNLPVLGASPKLADDNGWRREYNDHGLGGLYIIPANDNDSGKEQLVRFKGFAKDGTPITVPERQ